MALQKLPTILTVASLVSVALAQYPNRQFTLEEVLSPLNSEIASELLRIGRQAENSESIPINPPVKSGPRYVDPREYQNYPQNVPRNLPQNFIPPQGVPQGSVPQELAQSMQYPQNLLQISRIQNLPATQNIPQQIPPQMQFKPVSSVPVSVPPSHYNSQNLVPQSSKVLPQNLPLSASEIDIKTTKRECFIAEPNIAQLECTCFKSNNQPIREIASFPEMSGFKENLFKCPLPSLPDFGFSSFGQNLKNPFLPIASPVSAIFPPFGSMPPASHSNARCHFLRKIPIPPPTL